MHTWNLYKIYARAEAEIHRYLQHLASIRLQHLERIRTFSMHRLKRIAKPTHKQKTSFRRSFSFLDFAMLEASATQSFAEGLSCVSPTPRSLHLQNLPNVLTTVASAFLVLGLSGAYSFRIPPATIQHTCASLSSPHAPISVSVSARGTILS